MKFHFVRGSVTSRSFGTSLAVLQWLELVRGVRPVRAPANPFRVLEVRSEEHYCLHCFGLRWFDVIYAIHARIKRCRNCGKESGR